MIRMFRILLFCFTFGMEVFAQSVFSQVAAEDPSFSEICESINEKIKEGAELNSDESEHFSDCLSEEIARKSRLDSGDVEIVIQGYEAYGFSGREE